MKVIAIDIDGTALADPDKVRALYEDKNNVIVLHTARSSAIRKITEDAMHAAGIPYHALVMDKLRADVYIDDKNSGGLNWDVTTKFDAIYNPRTSATRNESGSILTDAGRVVLGAVQPTSDIDNEGVSK